MFIKSPYMKSDYVCEESTFTKSSRLQRVNICKESTTTNNLCWEKTSRSCIARKTWKLNFENKWFGCMHDEGDIENKCSEMIVMRWISVRNAYRRFSTRKHLKDVLCKRVGIHPDDFCFCQSVTTLWRNTRTLVRIAQSLAWWKKFMALSHA